MNPCSLLIFPQSGLPVPRPTERDGPKHEQPKIVRLEGEGIGTKLQGVRVIFTVKGFACRLDDWFQAHTRD